MAAKKKIGGLLIHASVIVREVPYNLIPDDFNYCDSKVTAEFPSSSKIIITIEKKPKNIGGRSYWYKRLQREECE